MQGVENFGNKISKLQRILVFNISKNIQIEIKISIIKINATFAHPHKPCVKTSEWLSPKNPLPDIS